MPAPTNGRAGERVMVPEGPAAAGVDGGATGSRILVLDGRGREMGRTEGPPLALGSMEIAELVRRIEALVREAGGPVRSLVAALAGAGRMEDRRAVEGALRTAPVAGTVRVVSDVEGAHRDAFGTGPGTLLVAGTGSVVLARTEAGGSVQIGGWGPSMGDEGSGLWIALEGLKAAARAHDGRGPETSLLDRLVEVCRVAEPRTLPGWIRGAARHEVAALAPMVLQESEAGDRQAQRIRGEAVWALREHLEVAARIQKEGAGPGVDVPPVALAGGLLRPAGPLREEVARAAGPAAEPLLAREVRGERGAARYALELLSEGGGGS